MDKYVVVIHMKKMGRPTSTRYYSEVREALSGRVVSRSWLYESEKMARKFADNWLADKIRPLDTM